MHTLTRLLLAFLVAASGLPVCRCVDHAGEDCRPIGDVAATPGEAAQSCCGGSSSSESAPESRDENKAPRGGCCCLDAPAPDPTAGPPAGLLAALVTGATHP